MWKGGGEVIRGWGRGIGGRMMLVGWGWWVVWWVGGSVGCIWMGWEGWLGENGGG